MKFAKKDLVCVYVGRWRNQQEIADTGAVEDLYQPDQYDVQRDQLGSLARHEEKHLFQPGPNGAVKRDYKKGYWVEYKWMPSSSGYDLAKIFHTRNGKKI